MRIVGREKLHAFSRGYPDSRKWIEAWIYETEAVRWLTSHDIKNRYPSASFLAGNVVIFNVRGNNYRLEVLVAYKVGLVTILWIGTHAEYDERNRKR